MWVTALIGSSTAFIEATLGTDHKEKDPLYGGYRGGPAYYIHHYMEEKTGKKKKQYLDCGFVCHFRFDLLVWDQPGNQ